MRNGYDARMRAWLLLSIVLPAQAAADPTPGHPTALPVHYAADRFFVTPLTDRGVRLRCYTDSGGGGAFVFDDRVERLGLVRTARHDGAQRFTTVAWPAFSADATIPPTIDPPYLVVLPRKDFGDVDADCFLGQSWFAGRVWTFDYPGQALWWRAPGDVPAHDAVHEVALAFPEEHGKRVGQQFARLEVTIDGERVPLLFDTGATVSLSPSAIEALHDGGPRERGGSFITQRTFDQWHQRHPKWRVLTNADLLGKHAMPMIEVAAVTVGGFTVGPVWFAARPNANFDAFMSSLTAGHVEGALGGSALRYLRVTVDYPRAIAVFEKP